MTNNKGMHWICKWVSAIIYFIRFELIRCKLPTTFKTQLIIFYVYSKNRNAFLLLLMPVSLMLIKKLHSVTI